MSAPDRNAHNWLIPVLAARGQYEAIEAIQDCWAEIERLRATAPTPDRIEAAARLLAKWIGYSWEGLSELDISAEFPDWAYNGIGTLTMQGGRPALRRIATEMLNV